MKVYGINNEGRKVVCFSHCGGIHFFCLAAKAYLRCQRFEDSVSPIGAQKLFQRMLPFKKHISAAFFLEFRDPL